MSVETVFQKVFRDCIKNLYNTLRTGDIGVVQLMFCSATDEETVELLGLNTSKIEWDTARSKFSTERKQKT